MMMMMLLSILVLILVPESVQTREHKLSINEETPIGSVVFDLNTLSPSITYQLLESSSLLSFNPSTNLIHIAKRIDRDTLCPNDDTCSKCIITMKLYDMFYHDILLLNIYINDINDNIPTFSSSTYSISLTENNMPGMKIRLSKAEDIDCSNNGVQLYELTYVRNGRVIISSIDTTHHRRNLTATESSQSFYLIYDSNSELYLVINMSLDRELQSEYIFTITANDHVHTSSTKLTLTVLDVNDHNARFSQSIYTVNVSQSTPAETILLKLNAFDADVEDHARIHYSLLSIDGFKLYTNDRSGQFRLDSRSGELRLASPFSQTTITDMKRVYKLIVAASDGANHAIPALATVFVHLIDDVTNGVNQPLISITFGSNRISNKNFEEVYLAENSPNATFIAYVSIEKFSQQQPPHWEVLPANDGGFFLQKLTPNSFTLLTDRMYDRENQSSYDVRIRAGKSQRQFRIVVMDVNDNAPKWNSSLFNIDLDSYFASDDDLTSTVALSLHATDVDEGENARVSYAKKSSSWPQWISLIDTQNGSALLVINCTLTGTLNETNDGCWFYLSNGEIWLDIEAYDHGIPRLSSSIRLRLYRSSILGHSDMYQFASLPMSQSTQQQLLAWLKHEYVLVGIAIGLGLLFVIGMIFVCVCCRRRQQRQTGQHDRWFGANNGKKKSSSLITAGTDDNSTKQKIIQTSSSSEQSSSAGSLYGSEKSDNVTVETATSCHLDMFLFSPKRVNLLRPPLSSTTDSSINNNNNYQFCFVNKSTATPTLNNPLPQPQVAAGASTESLTNKLFHSIQTDLSLLTENFRSSPANVQNPEIGRGTYV